MIHEGERNREEKLKLLSDLKISSKKHNKELSKRYFFLIACNNCGLLLTYEHDKKKDTYRMSYEFDNYSDLYKNCTDFKPFENNYKKTKYRYWGNDAKYLCLDCGYGIENKTGNTCDECGSNNLVEGKDIAGKPCPICETKLIDSFKLKGYNNYYKKENELKEKWFSIYRERYGVKEFETQKYTKKEIDEKKRQRKIYKTKINNAYYIINCSYNALHFSFRDAFLKGSFDIVLEWKNNSTGKFILSNIFNSLWIEKIIVYSEIEKVIELLMKYDFFNKSFFEDNQGLDGYTFGLEVKYKNDYKELAIWGIRNGILYDVGMLLLKMAGKTFKELYIYAW